MINFLKYRWLYFLISLVVIGTGVFSMIKWGFHYSIDFVGGANLEYQLNKKTEEEKIKKIFLANKIEITSLSIKDKVIVARLKSFDEKKEIRLRKELAEKLKVDVKLLKMEIVGPTVGKETIKKTLIASILAVLGILLYMTFAFRKMTFAMAAILALIHDILVVLGSYSLISHFFGAEIDVLFVTALLTAMSFSVHDTIVIFDKIREYLKEEGRFEVEFYANKALTETMIRSLNNSMTIIFMLLALALLGGATIKFFVVTLLIGTITGTYSSPFVATPILVWFEKRKKYESNILFTRATSD